MMGSSFGYHAMMHALRAIPWARRSVAVGLTVLGYLALTGYDVIALRSIGRREPLRRVLFGSFIGYAFTQTLGFALLTGGGIRFRFWSTWGLTAAEIGAGMTTVVAGFTAGLVAMCSVALIVAPSAGELLHLSAAATTALGIVGLGLIVGYAALGFRGRKAVRVGRFTLIGPDVSTVVAQLAVAAVEWTLAAAALYVLLPTGTIGFGPVLGAFMLAQLAGIASHLPGGVGVFEGACLLLLGSRVESGPLLGALVAFRGIYYLVPFTVAVAMLSGAEIVRGRHRLVGVVRGTGRAAGVMFGQWLPELLPFALGAAAFVAGGLLLVSGATPAIHSRILWLNHHLLPLEIIELSHFTGSLIGCALIVVGWGLTRRLDGAYRMAQGLLVAGIVASLLKGLDWEEALFLAIVFAMLWPARRAFHRRAALLSEPFSARWVFAIVAVLGLTTWLGFFAYRHVDYSGDLWWRFAVRADAPRYLRATVGVVAALGIFALARLLRFAPVLAQLPSADDLERVAPLVRTASASMANLAFLGDKTLLLSENGRGFLMYRVAGRSWVAMGDPVGGVAERRELVWRFREMADRHGGRTAFYEVSADNIPLYLDLGLTVRKIGEEAIVPLTDFSLDGSQRRGLRRVHREMTSERMSFAVEIPDETPALMTELRAVSDDWLRTKRSREKCFSLGRFDELYLSRFPIATIRAEDGRLLAFANLWSASASGELSMDLMRYRADAPTGVMTCLFIEMMLWGRANGFRTFNLGMAPLTGLESRALASWWHRAGAFLSRHAEALYHFQGLRFYKTKFDPEWRGRYLASPGGFALPVTLLDLASLVSGGLSGVVRK